MATFYFNGAVDNEWTSLASYATGAISFSGQPADAELVYIDGNFFQFDSDSSVTQGTGVVIGGTLADTLANLAAAIEAAALGISATVNGTDIDLVALFLDYPTSGGPTPFVTSDSLAVTTAEMTGGATGNWWTDADCTVPATSLPTSADDVIALSSINSNSGGEPTVANFTLNDPSNSYNSSIAIAITVTGNATFNDTSSTVSTVIGDATFNDSSFSSGTVTGNATFNGSSRNSMFGTVSGDATFNDSSYNYYTVTGDATFNDSSYNDWGSTITGDATFNDSSYNNGGVNGDATFNDSSYNGETIGGNATFNGSSHNIGTVNGDATFNGSSYNNSTVSSGTITGNATFNDSSLNYGTVNGNATFNDSSFASPSGTYSVVTIGTRTPYPIPRGINGSSILGVV